MATESRFGTWVAASRPRTLPAAVAPVIVGSAFAWDAGALNLGAALSCLGFALLIQIGTNFANDYFDFVKGADTAERVGPRRAVASGLVAPATMRRAMILTFGLAFLVGLTLLRFGGWPLLGVGLASIACGVLYTGGPRPLAYLGLGDVFVFVFFGLVAVGATFFVQAGRLATEVIAAGAAIGALSANILVANNYRDRKTDARAGKRTTVVRFGEAFAESQFLAAHVVAFAVPAGLAAVGHGLPVLLPLTLAPWAWRQSRRLRREASASQLIALLGDTGRYLAAYALLLAAGVCAAPGCPLHKVGLM
jgi:1,4-dihydroxy-2-naphthoate polyprenyltransferase